MNEPQEIINIPSYEIGVIREPKAILAEAKIAAQALMNVVKQKPKPVIMNGEQYLEFEDWQTVAKFYGLTAKVVRTTFIDLGGVKGFEATAEAIRLSDGMAVSSADAMCLNDEDKWSTRTKYDYVEGKRQKVGEVPVPLFQLRSMAQTRACAKALRNVLAWVVVLGGFKPQVAEEMTGDEFNDSQQKNGKPEVQHPKEKTAHTPTEPAKPSPEKNPQGKQGILEGDAISEPQRKRLYAIAMNAGMTKEIFQEWLMYNYNIDNSKEITKSQYEEICNAAGEYRVSDVQ